MAPDTDLDSAEPLNRGNHDGRVEERETVRENRGDRTEMSRDSDEEEEAECVPTAARIMHRIRAPIMQIPDLTRLMEHIDALYNELGAAGAIEIDRDDIVLPPGTENLLRLIDGTLPHVGTAATSRRMGIRIRPSQPAQSSRPTASNSQQATGATPSTGGPEFTVNIISPDTSVPTGLDNDQTRHINEISYAPEPILGLSPVGEAFAASSKSKSQETAGSEVAALKRASIGNQYLDAAKRQRSNSGHSRSRSPIGVIDKDSTSDIPDLMTDLDLNALINNPPRRIRAPVSTRGGGDKESKTGSSNFVLEGPPGSLGAWRRSSNSSTGHAAGYLDRMRVSSSLTLAAENDQRTSTTPDQSSLCAFGTSSSSITAHAGDSRTPTGLDTPAGMTTGGGSGTVSNPIPVPPGRGAGDSATPVAPASRPFLFSLEYPVLIQINRTVTRTLEQLRSLSPSTAEFIEDEIQQVFLRTSVKNFSHDTIDRWKKDPDLKCFRSKYLVNNPQKWHRGTDFLRACRSCQEAKPKRLCFGLKIDKTPGSTKPRCFIIYPRHDPRNSDVDTPINELNWTDEDFYL